jgi:hypothetical protein
VFRVGDQVVWITEAFHHKVGIVTNVIPNDRELNEFTVYDVTFDFGLRTLHGSELQAIPPNISSCDEKNALFVAYKKAADVYLQAVSQLSDLVGILAHTEFEFLASKVERQRNASATALERLCEHRTQHGC